MVNLSKIKSKAREKFRKGYESLFNKPRRFKDRVDLGCSPSTIVEDINAEEMTNAETNDNR
jgi:hypothetical protein